MSTNDTKQVPLCFYCGEPLCWDADFDASDIFPSNFKDDKYATVSYLHCPNCGRDYEISDPIKEERETNYSNYWNDKPCMK